MEGPLLTKFTKPMAEDYTDLKKYVADKKIYAQQMGKNPNKVALYKYKEMGIYSIDDLLELLNGYH